jgi:hypothetical protein
VPGHSARSASPRSQKLDSPLEMSRYGTESALRLTQLSMLLDADRSHSEPSLEEPVSTPIGPSGRL